MACVPELLGVVKFNCDPEYHSGSVRKVRFGSLGRAPFTDYKDPLEWATVLDDATVDVEKIRTFELEADLPVPTWKEEDIGFGETRRTEGIQTLPFIIRDISPENYAFFQSVKKGVKGRGWYEDKTRMYSNGNVGLLMTMFVDFTIPTGGGLHTAIGRYEWDAEEVTLMIASPLAV